MTRQVRDKRRLATILSIDVVGYSRLMQRDSRGLLVALNTVFKEVVVPAVQSSGGRIVKTMGDGALIEFASALDAVKCAVEIQQRTREEEPRHAFSEPIELRMGLDAGDVLSQGSDIFGECVNAAARLQSASDPGGVLLSRTVARMAGSDLPFRLQSQGVRRFKNLDHPIETLSVDFSDVVAENRRRHRAEALKVQFCRSTDGQSLAWAEVGRGAPIVKAPAWISHLQIEWNTPTFGHMLEFLSSENRLVYFDARGNGLSGWDLKDVSFDLMVDDLEAVFDAANVKRAPIFAISQGCAIAVAFAARAPERVSGIVMIGGYPQGRGKRDSIRDRERAAAMQAMLTAGWDDDYPSLRDLIAQLLCPGVSEEDRRRYAEDMRHMISPENMGRYRAALDNIDVTAILPEVKCPCLVMHANGDRMQPIDQGRMMAAGLPNAKFVSLDSDNHDIPEHDPVWPMVQREIRAFLDEHADS